ncbi:hypothetical protein Smic_23680 [Streptomyces microflavus]|uniref:Uncharacterized protein n=1 Tax=Streptomyces microflavus TaxID=1919 RepID=A0A7J0CMT6_STRMI|nr:hypothetical protein Smic_23680 [Streptomyces microflavus]
MVRDDLQGARAVLRVREGALDPDLRVRELHLCRVEAHQPAGGGVQPVVGGAAHGPFELTPLVRVEELFHGPADLPGEDVRVERGLHQVVLDGGEGRGDLAVREVLRAPHGGEVDALRAGPEAGERGGQVEPLG